MANADACVNFACKRPNFACKRPNFADVEGGEVKNGKILQTSFMDGPLLICTILLIFITQFLVSMYSVRLICIRHTLLPIIINLLI